MPNLFGRQKLQPFGNLVRCGDLIGEGPLFRGIGGQFAPSGFVNTAAGPQ